MTHKVYVKLNQTFITPFDREDIAELTARLDDVLDFVNGASDRLMTYKIDCPPPAAAEAGGGDCAAGRSICPRRCRCWEAGRNSAALRGD